MGYEECQKCFSVIERYRMRRCKYCNKDNWYCNACFKKYDICHEYKTVKKKYCQKCLKEYKDDPNNNSNHGSDENSDSEK
jgi:hypothetical protein